MSMNVCVHICMYVVNVYKSVCTDRYKLMCACTGPCRQ